MEKSSGSSGGVTADKLVVWNCNNHGAANFGMLSCNVELRKAGQVVWSKAAIPLAWKKDGEPETTIPLPKSLSTRDELNRPRLMSWGSALCEVEILRGHNNLARGKTVTASGSYSRDFLPATVVDGIKNSSQDRTGFWVAPEHQLAWVEVQVAPSTGRLYLSDLPALDAQVHHLTSLTQQNPVNGKVCAHG